MKPLLDFLKGKWLGHPLHPILAHVPMAMWPGALIFDLLSQCPIAGNAIVRLSSYALLLGVVTALPAAVPGFVDYYDIRRDHPGKAIATKHMTLNLMVVAIYGINLWLRSSALAESKINLVPLFLSFIGIGLLSASGYLGCRLF